VQLPGRRSDAVSPPACSLKAPKEANWHAGKLKVLSSTYNYLPGRGRSWSAFKGPAKSTRRHGAGALCQPCHGGVGMPTMGAAARTAAGRFHQASRIAPPTARFVCVEAKAKRRIGDQGIRLERLTTSS